MRAISLCFEIGLCFGYLIIFLTKKSCGVLSFNLVIPRRATFGTCDFVLMQCAAVSRKWFDIIDALQLQLIPSSVSYPSAA